MSRIAARKPFYVSNASDTSKDLTVRLKIYDVDAAAPTDYDYVIQKQKYSTDAELLEVDISKYIRDHFKHNISALGANYGVVGGETGVAFHTLKVTAVVNGVSTTYFAYDGWEDLPDDNPPTDGDDRPIYVGTPLIAEFPSTMTAIKWGVYGGSTSTQAGYTQPLNGELIGMKVLRGLTVTAGDKVWIESYTGGTAWKRDYEIVCPYNDAMTIMYINRFGLWEGFDVVGKSYWDRQATSEQYMSSLGYSRKINSQAKRMLRAHIGIVPQNFSKVLEDILLSETIGIWDGTTLTPLILTTASAKEILTRGDDLRVPQLTFEYANPIIPTV